MFLYFLKTFEPLTTNWSTLHSDSHSLRRCYKCIPGRAFYWMASTNHALDWWHGRISRKITVIRAASRSWRKELWKDRPCIKEREEKVEKKLDCVLALQSTSNDDRIRVRHGDETDDDFAEEEERFEKRSKGGGKGKRRKREKKEKKQKKEE